MAKLSSGKSSLEIIYKGVDYDEATLEIGFLWDGESIINDAVLRRSGKWWDSRSTGKFLASDECGDSFIKVIDRALETDDPDYWRGSNDEDVTFVIYPSLLFPFFIHYLTREKVAKDDSVRRQIWYEGKSKDEEKRDYDSYTLIVLIDNYNFKDSGWYSNEGISLHLIVTRDNLQAFRDELMTEFLEFKETYKFAEKVIGDSDGNMEIGEVISVGEIIPVEDD